MNFLVFVLLFGDKEGDKEGDRDGVNDGDIDYLCVLWGSGFCRCCLNSAILLISGFFKSFLFVDLDFDLDTDFYILDLADFDLDLDTLFYLMFFLDFLLTLLFFIEFDSIVWWVAWVTGFSLWLDSEIE